MSLIKPLKPYLARAEKVDALIAPPYDIVSHQQVQHYISRQPDSIIKVTRPDGLFDKTSDPSIIEKGYEIALGLLKQKQSYLYEQQIENCFLIYQITGQDLLQTGLVCLANTKFLKTHELTRRAKVEDRMALSKALNCQISPVMLSTSSKEQLSALLNAKTANAQALYKVSYQGCEHQLSLVSLKQDVSDIAQFFSSDKTIYITDGHHRSQTQLTLHQAQPEQFSEHILSVIFPGEALNILGYHRVVKLPEGCDAVSFWHKVEVHFDVKKSAEAFLPSNALEFGCYIDKQWYQLNYKDETTTKLAIDILHGLLIEPYFKVCDPKEDLNIDFIGGLEATRDIEAWCVQQPNWVGFTLAPTTLDTIIETADANRIMPPKSTYFEPKLLDGFVLQEEAQIKY